MKRPSNPTPSKPEDIELPESAQVVADVIGRAATLQLSKVAKGRKIYIPVTLCAGHDITRCGRLSKESRPRCTCKGHWLAATVGDELAVLLCRTFGGESLDLAPCYYVHAFERNRRIREEFAAGKSQLDLRREHGMSERAIRYIVKGFNGRQDRPNGRDQARNLQ